MKTTTDLLVENISLWQLFVLIINFGLGSTIVVGLGNEARQDAWIAVIGATTFGVGIIWFFHKLCMRVPHKNLLGIFECTYGKLIAMGLALIYCTYFFDLASLVLRDFGELMVTAVLPNTPIEIINFFLMILASYMVYLGIEVVARTSEIYSPYSFFFIFLLGIFLIVGSQFHLRNLQPILPEGYKPLVKALFPSMITFPYGEMVVFTIIMAQVTQIKSAGKTAMISIGVLGFLLAFSVLVQFGTLGVDQRVRSNFPLLSAAREISIADFIERLDSLVVFIMMLGILVKVCLFFYAGLKSLEYVFSLTYRAFVFPMAMLITLFSILHAENFSEHITEGLKIVPYYLHLPLQLVIPIITYVIIWWKQRRTQTQKSSS